MITRLALERARALRADLARLADNAARATLATEVAAGRAEPSRDFRDGSEQQLVELGPAGAAWGYAVTKTCVVVTVVDEPGARYLRARGSRPVAPRKCAACGHVEVAS